ncbi:hypothetical protein GGX14DRAFT_386888 [Mycena pura]|uniref:Uncharacterized protein n=1 Tax=Mycena pura TaxID=153505 RepID=A0AAD6YML0_9AGAR|nr:hypothetical protein GGX14DRAFT_386888 [Mycena pura]
MSASDFLPLLTSLPASGAATNAIAAVFALIITTLFIHCASPMRLTDVLVIAMDETEKTYVDAFEMGVRPIFDNGIAKTMTRLQIQVSDIRAASLRQSLSYRSGLWQFFKGRTFTLLCCIWEVQSLKTHIEIMKEEHLRAGYSLGGYGTAAAMGYIIRRRQIHFITRLCNCLY